MENRIKPTILFAVLCLFSFLSFAQYSQHPPEPRMDHEAGHIDQPCVEIDDDDTPFENPGGGPITPPPGLCMPINDYLYPLLVLGILYGAYGIQKVQTARETSD